nr:glutathione S-transferase omega-like [Halisarca dujardinii]
MPINEIKERPPAPKEGDYIRMYTSTICPFAERAHLFLAAKGLDAEFIYVSLQKKPEWYLEIYPKGQVPFFEQNGQRLGESAIISEYLDEKYGEKKLFPTDPWQKAVIKEFVESFGSKFLPNWYKHYFSASTEESNTTLANFLTGFDDRLKQPNHPFLFGEEVTAGDLLVWPWFERLEAATTVFPDLAKLVSKDKLAATFAWMDRMQSLDMVKKCASNTEAHLRFYQSLKSVNKCENLHTDRKIDLYVKSAE